MNTEHKVERFVDQFIGRQDILEIISATVNDKSHKYVLRLIGQGGAGKTALLRKVAKLYEYNDDVVVFPIDYAQSRFQSLSALANTMVTAFVKWSLLAAEEHEAYKQILAQADAEFHAGETGDKVNEILIQGYLYLISRVNVNLVKQGKRLLILSDSIEYSTDTEQGKRINQLASYLENAVIIVAGRPEELIRRRFEEEYPEIFSRDWLLPPIYELGAFDVENAIEYFATVLNYPPERSITEKIVFLTKGSPILLAITVEWLKRNIDLPEAIQRKLENPSAPDLDKLRRTFEEELVRGVIQLDKPLDDALLKLAYLDRRYDPRILKIVLGWSEEEIMQREPELQSMAFVRSFLEDSAGLLHDEAKRLIMEHAWKHHDSGGEEKHNLARKVIDEFYLPEIKRMREQLALQTVKAFEGYKEPLTQDAHQVYEWEIECLDYHYRISVDNSRRYLTELLQDVLSPQKQDFIYHALYQRDPQEAKIAATRMNLKRGDQAGAEEILLTVLSQADLSEWYRIRILQELSDIPVEPARRAGYLNEALAIAEQVGDQLEVARIHNYLGLMYRRQGLWAEAEQAYKKAIAILKQVETAHPDTVQLASTFNNLAYIHLLNGEIELADSLATIAFNQRQAIGHQLGLAFSFTTRGEIAYTKGHLELATRSYEAAATIFKEAGREQYYADALIRLSTISRSKRNFDEAEEQLQLGLQQPTYEILAKAQRELGALHRTQGSSLEGLNTVEQRRYYKDARKAFEASLRTSRLKHDWFGQAQALLDIVFLGYLDERRIDEGYKEQLEAILEDHKFPVIEAHLLEIISDAMYDNNKIMMAFQQYIQVGQILCKYHYRKSEAMLTRLKRRFLHQPIDVQNELCNIFSKIKEPPESRFRKFLDNLCRAIEITSS